MSPAAMWWCRPRRWPLPSEISDAIGTSTRFAAWNAAIYVAQVEDDRLATIVVNRTAPHRVFPPRDRNSSTGSVPEDVGRFEVARILVHG